MKFKITALETEDWKRVYIVEAKNKKEAEKIYFDGDFEDREFIHEETFNCDNQIDSIEVVK